MSKTKPAYSAVPLRAAGDKTLTAEAHRVLQVIAAHDRLGANGIGCYAGHERIAELASCDYHSLSRTLKALVGAGYLEAGRHPLNAKLRVYKVIYTTFDAAYFQGGKVSSTANAPVSTPANADAQIVSKPILEAERIQWDESVNIFSETVRIHPVETDEIHPVETAPRMKSGVGVGAMLAMIERGINAGSVKSGPTWLRYLESCVADLDRTDPNYGRALRLLETYGGDLGAAA